MEGERNEIRKVENKELRTGGKERREGEEE